MIIFHHFIDRKYIARVTVIATLAICVSCSSHVELEDFFKTVDQKLMRSFNAEFGSIAPDHTWNTVAQRTLKISLPTDESIYEVRVTTADPRDAANSSFLLADYIGIKAGGAQEFVFDAPAHLKTVYVAIKDEKQDNELKPVTFDGNGVAEVVFAEALGSYELYYYEDMQYFLAFEDLGIAVDMDYNDVILGIKHVSGRDNAKVRIMAVGSVLNIKAFFNDEPLYRGKELHDLFGVTNTTLINAFALGNTFTLEDRKESSYLTSTYADAEVSVKLPEGFSLSKDADMFVIKTSAYEKASDDYTKVISWTKEKGKTPWAMLIAEPLWEWPSEGTSIGKAYSGFKSWVTNPNKYDWFIE